MSNFSKEAIIVIVTLPIIVIILLAAIVIFKKHTTKIIKNHNEVHIKQNEEYELQQYREHIDQINIFDISHSFRKIDNENHSHYVKTPYFHYNKNIESDNYSDFYNVIYSEIIYYTIKKFKEIGIKELQISTEVKINLSKDDAVTILKQLTEKEFGNICKKIMYYALHNILLSFCRQNIKENNCQNDQTDLELLLKKKVEHNQNCTFLRNLMPDFKYKETPKRNNSENPYLPQQHLGLISVINIDAVLIENLIMLLKLKQHLKFDNNKMFISEFFSSTFHAIYGENNIFTSQTIDIQDPKSDKQLDYQLLLISALYTKIEYLIVINKNIESEYKELIEIADDKKCVDLASIMQRLDEDIIQLKIHLEKIKNVTSCNVSQKHNSDITNAESALNEIYSKHESNDIRFISDLIKFHNMHYVNIINNNKMCKKLKTIKSRYLTLLKYATEASNNYTIKLMLRSYLIEKLYKIGHEISLGLANGLSCVISDFFLSKPISHLMQRNRDNKDYDSCLHTAICDFINNVSKDAIEELKSDPKRFEKSISLDEALDLFSYAKLTHESFMGKKITKSEQKFTEHCLKWKKSFEKEDLMTQKTLMDLISDKMQNCNYTILDTDILEQELQNQKDELIKKYCSKFRNGSTCNKFRNGSTHITSITDFAVANLSLTQSPMIFT